MDWIVVDRYVMCDVTRKSLGECAAESYIRDSVVACPADAQPFVKACELGKFLLCDVHGDLGFRAGEKETFHFFYEGGTREESFRDSGDEGLEISVFEGVSTCHDGFQVRGSDLSHQNGYGVRRKAMDSGDDAHFVEEVLKLFFSGAVPFGEIADACLDLGNVFGLLVGLHLGDVASSSRIF